MMMMVQIAEQQEFSNLKMPGERTLLLPATRKL